MLRRQKETPFHPQQIRMLSGRQTAVCPNWKIAEVAYNAWKVYTEHHRLDRMVNTILEKYKYFKKR